MCSDFAVTRLLRMLAIGHQPITEIREFRDSTKPEPEVQVLGNLYSLIVKPVKEENY